MISTSVRLLLEKIRSNDASVSRKITQLFVLFIIRRIGPGYFLFARFWRKDIRLSDMLEHYGASTYRKKINRVNHIRFQKLSQHKVAEKALLALQGLPTPRYIGFYHKERGGSASGSTLRNEHELRALLEQHVSQRICFKKAEGSGGSSFAALDVIREGADVELRHPITGLVISVSDLARELETFRSGSIIEEFLVQHPQLAALNPDSVNTLRLIVVHTESGFVTRGAMLRLGRSGSQVDNTSNGGLACPIDVKSGRIVEVLDLTPARNTYECHPDSGERVLGLEIPHWDVCLDLAGKALAAFPRMTFAGVDMAITEHGPSIIELNVDPDRRFAAHLDLPHGQLFSEVTE